MDVSDEQPVEPTAQAAPEPPATDAAPPALPDTAPEQLPEPGPSSEGVGEAPAAGTAAAGTAAAEVAAAEVVAAEVEPVAAPAAEPEAAAPEAAALEAAAPSAAAPEATVRLFVAVRLPDAVRDDLAAAVSETREVRAVVGDDGAALRWVDATRWHLTLAFLGDVPESRVPALIGRLERAAGRISPFSLRFSGGGRFGDRVLWAGVRGGRRPRPAPRLDAGRSPAGTAPDQAQAPAPARGGKPVDLDLRSLRGLAGTVAAAARKTGIALEDRPYRAHLTLARAAAGAELAPWASALATYEGPAFRVTSIALVRSTLGPRPAYDVVAEMPLAAPRPRA